MEWLAKWLVDTKVLAGGVHCVDALAGRWEYAVGGHALELQLVWREQVLGLEFAVLLNQEQTFPPQQIASQRSWYLWGVRLVERGR